MAGNSNLQDSRNQKQDEFYTQYKDIEKELSHYNDAFCGKRVLCNCDDPEWSNFWKYFKDNYDSLHLERLTATHYEATEEPSYRLDYDGKHTIKTMLNGNGDFQSDECKRILEESDICVTNPPFSKMKCYLPYLITSGKQYLILGNLNHVTMKNITPFFLDGSCWLGYESGHLWFMVPDDYEEKGTDYKQDENGQKWRRIGNCCWFTNISISKNKPFISLTKSIKTDKYEKYDNYDVINVNKVDDIPFDWDGVMGVPITFLSRYCPEQFQLLGLANSNRYIGYPCITRINGKNKYQRVLIRRKGGITNG